MRKKLLRHNLLHTRVIHYKIKANDYETQFLVSKKLRWNWIQQNIWIGAASQSHRTHQILSDVTSLHASNYNTVYCGAGGHSFFLLSNCQTPSFVPNFPFLLSFFAFIPPPFFFLTFFFHGDLLNQFQDTHLKVKLLQK